MVVLTENIQSAQFLGSMITPYFLPSILDFAVENTETAHLQILLGTLHYKLTWCGGGGGSGGGGGFFLVCENLGRMFNDSFPACTFF